VDAPYTLTVFSDGWGNLSAGEQYLYRYLARNAAGWSLPSEPVLMTVGTEPE